MCFQTFYVTIDIPSISNKIDNEEAAPSRTGQAPKFKNNIIKPSAQLQFTDLKEDHPLVKISNNTISAQGSSSSSLSASKNGFNSHTHNSGVIDPSALIDGKIYQTDWNQLQGTELIFDENGQFIGKVKEHLTCNNNTKFTLKKAEEVEQLRSADDSIMDIDQDSQGQQPARSQFLKRAIVAARAKGK